MRLALTALVAVSLSRTLSAAPTDSAGIEFFERKVRPVLVERCHQCHSARSEKLKGGLRLDSREGVLKGGESGPVLNPENPETSKLIEAIHYQNPDLQMPPKGKLPDAQIADLTDWVKMGAPWPGQEAAPTSTMVAKFDLEKRRQEHWAWQPIRAVTPPQVRTESWPTGPVDRFLLARLEQKKMQPAAAADRRTLLRRLCFDLTGLPPSARQVERFVSATQPQAYTDVVEELLASPHFGERWARHWLDLVRYSETLGHEFDFAIQNAWRYRDYVIRAFNNDLPYDQFVVEHIAGDLLEPPRRHPAEQFNESILGTAFYWMGQREHSPVDVRFHQAEVIDNQIDVLTKTFLGLTVACARCHDHKFDAISTRDYYALYGVMESSRYAQRAIDSEADLGRQEKELDQLRRQIVRELQTAWSKEVDAVAHRLNDAVQPPRWLEALAQKEVREPEHILFPWLRISDARDDSPAEASAAWQALRREASVAAAPGVGSNDVLFAEAQGYTFPGWFDDGGEAGSRPEVAAGLTIGATNSVLQFRAAGAACDSAVSRRQQRILQSPTFEIERRYLHVLAAGRDSRIKVCVDNLTMLRDPIYGRLKQALKSDGFQWHTFDLEMWRGHRAYVELTDIPTVDPTEDGQKRGYSENGFFAGKRVVFSDRSSPPPAEPVWAQIVRQAPEDSFSALAAAYQTVAGNGLRRWAGGGKNAHLSDAEAALFNWLAKNNLLDSTATPRLAALIGRYQQLEASLPNPQRSPSMVDGNGIDEHVFIRGNHKTPGEKVSRSFLTALNSRGAIFNHGSGRLELARALVDRANPLTARVWVNRVWLHLFGRGLVASPDDFGELGERPSHPELLDWLAEWFRTEAGWSTKKLIRLLLHSQAYQMASRASDAQAEEIDPDNVWLHRMPLRRLEAEALRDAMLAVSGTLDPTMFGPPVAVHLTEFMEAVGRPPESGPLDGSGRRSIYLESRRNFISPMMRTFDAPTPLTTIGRRTSSNLPAQSLILLNDPFVLGQAQAWARRLLADPDLSSEKRIDQIYRAAFARPANDNERSKALAFLEQQARLQELPPAEWQRNEKIWTDLCHVVFNLKEFLFIE